MTASINYIRYKGFKIVKRYRNCHNEVYKVKDENSHYMIIKTNGDEKSKDLLKNEIKWLEKRQQLEDTLNIKLPNLIKSEIYKGQIFLIIAYIDGFSLKQILLKGDLDECYIVKLAEFTDRIKKLRYIDTMRSHGKKELSFEEWDKVFLDNLKKWHSDIIRNSSNRIRVLIDTLYEKAKDFHTEDAGLGGIHGSAKLDEFIYDDKEDLYVLDWERASSVYINFYQTASIASYFLIRLRQKDLTNKFLSEREKLLNKSQYITYKGNFHKILSQRILGDIWDLTQEGDIESVSGLNIKEFIN